MAITQVGSMIGMLIDHRTLPTQVDQGRIKATTVEKNRAMCHQRSELEFLLIAK
jgi:hypothetical protein